MAQDLQKWAEDLDKDLNSCPREERLQVMVTHGEKLMQTNENHELRPTTDYSGQNESNNRVVTNADENTPNRTVPSESDETELKEPPDTNYSLTSNDFYSEADSSTTADHISGEDTHAQEEHSSENTVEPNVCSPEEEIQSGETSLPNIDVYGQHIDPNIDVQGQHIDSRSFSINNIEQFDDSQPWCYDNVVFNYGM